MTLLSLPNELLGRIVEETMPEGFENFLLSCKSVCQAGKAFLDEHNTLRRRYRRFYYTGDGDLADPDACCSSLQLIALIAEDPRIAKYIVSADLKEDFSPQSDEYRKALLQHLKYSSSFKALLRKSPYLRKTGNKPSDVRRHFMKQCILEVGNHTLAATFLLTLLPNVTQISLPTRWEHWDNVSHSSMRWDISSLLDAIVKRANDHRNTAAGLSKLHTILPSTAWGYENRWKLSTFTPFLSIESVRMICAGSTRVIDDGYTGAAFREPPYETFGKGLEVVELVGAVVDDQELRKFLSRMPRLKTFRLSYETKWHGCGHNFDAGAVMNAIADAVGDQLEELSFSVLNCFGDIERVVSMKTFARLRKLELDVGVVIGELPAGEVHHSLAIVPFLSDLCPPAIENLQLVAPYINVYPCAFRHLFSEPAADVVKKLPNLKRISIRVFSEEADESISARMDNDCKKKMNIREWSADLESLETSVKVEVVEVDDVALPEFMSRFCSRYDVETM